MVITARLFRFARQQEGTALIEGLIVFPLVLLTIAAFVEFGYAVFQWNQTVKALQAGARNLAVSEPLIVGGVSGLEATGDAGDPVPATVVSQSCGAPTVPCDVDRMKRLIFGTTDIGIDDKCDNLSDNTIPGMCDFNPRIGVGNVLVTYYRAGLGYVGRPDGAVLTIRLEVKDISFSLPLVGALLNLDRFTIPANPVTITSEDLCSTRSC